MIDQAAQNVFHRSEGLHLLFNAGDFGFGARANINTTLLRLNPQGQKFLNFTERKTQFLSAFNESQPVCRFRGKLTIACFRPWRLR